jgi:hypothetical protein
MGQEYNEKVVHVHTSSILHGAQLPKLHLTLFKLQRQITNFENSLWLGGLL